MRIKFKDLKMLIHSGLIKEASSLSQISLDDQIDSILTKFENESIIEDEEAFESKRYSLKKIIFEAPEDEEENDENDEEEVEDIELGGEEEEGADPLSPEIDLQKFTNKVARLIKNSASLLDIESVIANRAKEFLLQNYGKKVAREFEETMESQRNIKLHKMTSEPLDIPMAVGAGGSGLA